jgi:ribosome biogenesis GTP-binding protein ysxC
MIIKKAQLETVCGITSKFPENSEPELVFAGKSNVGKSSLINALMNRKSLARTSSQPGKTQTINYYKVNDEIYFVDLPGYGYANANIETKAKWGKMIEKYLHTSKQIKCIFLLIDIRHEPGKNDKQMYDWILHNGYQPVIIATKLDKLKRSQVAKCVKIVRDGLGLPKEGVLIPFSSQTKQGKEEIYDFIENLLAGEQV